MIVHLTNQVALFYYYICGLYYNYGPTLMYEVVFGGRMTSLAMHDKISTLTLACKLYKLCGCLTHAMIG